MLREAVANLAAPPTLQVAYLDRIFVQCTGGGSAAAYGNEVSCSSNSTTDSLVPIT